MVEQLIVKFIFCHDNYGKEFVHEIVKIERFQKTKHQFWVRRLVLNVLMDSYSMGYQQKYL
jgi:hypothetical protein